MPNLFEHFRGAANAKRLVIQEITVLAKQGLKIVINVDYAADFFLFSRLKLLQQYLIYGRVGNNTNFLFAVSRIIPTFVA
jgi:hypothetical protein